jgi:hypothetical protein
VAGEERLIVSWKMSLHKRGLKISYVSRNKKKEKIIERGKGL